MSLTLVNKEEKQPEKNDEEQQHTPSLPGCPICLNDMSPPDVSYPLVCPTASCDFNICLHCIQGMLQSEADGYQEASDGSHQVKFCVSCPACRTKYNPLAATTATAVATNATSNNTKNSNNNTTIHYDQSIIHHVLLLRRVYAVQLLLPVKDSELSATHLSLKHDFLQNTRDLSFEKVQDAFLLFQKYLKDVKKDELLHNKKSSSIPELDWTKLDALMKNDKTTTLPPCINMTTSRSSTNSTSGSTPNGSPSSEQQQHSQSQYSQQQQQQQQAPPWRDVTLFYGVLEDVMTLSEQEFLTQLFISGQPDLVAQAAHIVQGILGMSMQRQAPKSSSNGNTARNSNNNAPTTTTKKAPPSLSPKKLAQLRGRFPLPRHMPLCVALPVYDPTSRSPLLSFEPPPSPKSSAASSQYNNELIVARVHGPAGRLGLRRGDVVTHVQGGCEPVPDRAAWDAHLQQLLQQSSSSPTAAAANRSNHNNSSSTMVTLVVVNANAATATALRERAIQMQRELKHGW